MDSKRIIPGMGYYLKNRKIVDIFKGKHALLGAGGDEGRINLLSNSLEHMGYFCGHKEYILSLCAVSSNILASGSGDRTIKIWDIEDRCIMSTLSGHTYWVSALCYVREGVFVSGSYDKSLIIWDKLPASHMYSPAYVLTGHTSYIEGIIRINNRHIISGEDKGDLRIWDIDQGNCIKYIPNVGQLSLYEMKQHIRGGELVVDYRDTIIVWGSANNWSEPIQQFSVSDGNSIEFLSEDILLRGGMKGQLEFIDCVQTEGQQLPPIQLYSDAIYALLRIAKDIVTSSADGTLKVIDPRSKICYLIFKEGECIFDAIAYFY